MSASAIFDARCADKCGGIPCRSMTHCSCRRWSDEREVVPDEYNEVRTAQVTSDFLAERRAAYGYELYNPRLLPTVRSGQ